MMTMPLLIVAGLLCLTLIYYAVRGQVAPFKTLNQIEEHTIPVDLLAFQNLIDPRDQQFLRERLPASNYRKMQRKRILACIVYVRCCARNAAVLIRVGESASEDANPEVRATGHQIIGEALRMRIFAIAVVPKLYLWFLFPDSQLSLAALCKRYSKMSAAAGDLSRLQNPDFPLRILSAL